MTIDPDTTYQEPSLPLAGPPPNRIRLDIMSILDGTSGTAKVIAIQYTGTDQRMTSKTVHDHVVLSELTALCSELLHTELEEVLGTIGAF